MFSILLSLFLALQMMLSSVVPFPPSERDMLVTYTQEQPRQQQLMWGMLDPELSTWFARIPMNAEDEAYPILWNWSWRGFWAALFEQPMLKEAAADAPSI